MRKDAKKHGQEYSVAPLQKGSLCFPALSTLRQLPYFCFVFGEFCLGGGGQRDGSLADVVTRLAQQRECVLRQFFCGAGQGVLSLKLSEWGLVRPACVP